MGAFMLNGVPYGLQDATKADKADIASIITTGATNATGATITAGTYFYLNGTLVRALVDIASGATYTLNTNYEAVTVGEELYDLGNYTVIHTAAANQTYKAQLLDLRDYALAIPTNLRHRLAIRISEIVYRSVSYANYSIVNAATDGSINITAFRMVSSTNAVASIIGISTAGVITFADRSNTNNSNAMELVLL